MALPVERTAVEAVRMLAAGGEQPSHSRAQLVASLSNDLDGPRRGQALQGLCDMLGDDRGDNGSRAAAVAQVLDSVSWEVFGLVMGCLEQSTTSSRYSSDGSSTGDRLSADTPRQADEIAALAEKLALELAEIFSPKELHIMALEHLHAYSEKRTVRTVLAVLRRSTQRMPPTRRAKFLEAALQPALKATRRVAAAAAAAEAAAAVAAEAAADSAPATRRRQEPSSCYDDDGDGDEDGSDGRSHGPGALSPPVAVEHEMSSRAAYEVAASSAETAMEFVGPLAEQACAEREKIMCVCGPIEAAEVGGGGWRGSPGSTSSSAGIKDVADSPVGSGEEAVSASDLSLAAYLGFALSALELAAETSACMAATAAAAAAATTCVVPPALLPFEEKSAAVEALTKAEEQLVGLVIGGPVAPLDLQFTLLHGCRLTHADRVKRRILHVEKGDGEERVRVRGRGRASLSAGCGGGLVGLAEATVGGALPWTSEGVATVAYLVACRPRLREKWLPLVWSRRTERRLFLPHSEVLMRNKSKRIACKGLELACFVAERLGPLPDHAGAFAFDWESEDDGFGAWASGEQEQEVNAAAAATTTTTTGSSTATEEARPPPPPPRRKPLDPHRFDLAAFLQVLVDVMVSCPLPALRARGHAAMSAFLGAAGETCRFRVLERLIERCPWPNATGLLLDSFRREIDRALRWQRQHRVEQEQEEEEEEGRLQEDLQEGRRHQQNSPQRSLPSGTAAAAASSPFASALAGDFVSAQLRRACRGGPPASLMMDMDSRTGALTLARYAHALDFDGQGAGAEAGAGAGAGPGVEVGVGGRLKLREPEKLRENRRLVEGLLDKLRGAAVTADSAGPEHFRLFILEDAAQQCLEELQR